MPPHDAASSFSRLSLGGVLLAAAVLAGQQSRAAQLVSLTSFNGANGRFPTGLIVDGAGNLFGATAYGGTQDQGTIFEIPRNAGGYAGAPVILVNFNGANGAVPPAGPIMDAEGNLFGTTGAGGGNERGTVFEIVKTGGGYAVDPMTLVNFDGTNGAFPVAGVIADPQLNLFGTTSEWSAIGETTIFEIAKTAGGYAGPSPISTLASSNTGLVTDPAGNLFGTTIFGHSSAVVEIRKTASGFANTQNTVINFTDAGEVFVIADPHGNLLGTTAGGGATNMGLVFEIPKTAPGQPAVLIPLVEFNGSNGAGPAAVLIRDAEGNLFGTTSGGGANNMGTVFEIASTATGYAAAPILLASFDGNNGSSPMTGLVADAAGNLFGTTSQGGANDLGTIFEVTGSGFAVPGVFAGTPGSPNCQRQSVLALIAKFGALRTAAAVLNDPSAAVLRHKIVAFCAHAGSGRSASSPALP